MSYIKAKNLTRILAIDYGNTRIGLALSDIMQIIAKPYKTIKNSSKESVLNVLNDIIDNQNVGKIVVGLPMTLNNTISKQTDEVNKYIEFLKKELSLPVVTYDERLTSISAKRSLVEQGIKTGHNKGYVDMTAAAIFLQNYLDENSNNK